MSVVELKNKNHSERQKNKNDHLVVREIDSLGQALIDNPGTVSAFLGVSLGNRLFSKDSIRLYLEWATFYSDTFALVIDDWEEQYNYQVFKGLSHELALKKALKRGQELNMAFTRVRKQIPEDKREKVEIVRSSELFQGPEHAKIWDFKQRLSDFFYQDFQFKQAITQQVHANIGGKIATLQVKLGNAEYGQSDHLLESLSPYLLDELAVTMYIRESMGFPIEIYPGSAMPVVAGLYSGQYPDLVHDLSSGGYGHIYLNLERHK